jgi:ABC-type Fe3+/spermidine/putrescine transport system ATPase subunit
MPSVPHHQLALDTRIGGLHLQVSLELCAPWTILFGPSGSGKTTILRALCGLVPSDDPTPPHLRNLAYAPQNAAVFPHLTVRENVAFPLTVRRLAAAVDPLLELFALTPLADRLPRDLSGGELQRTALARAFAVPAPTLLLLDEPFTGIDRPTRDRLIPAMQHYVAARNIPVLSVTHDIEEAILLNAEIIRIEAGRILAQGPAQEVLAQERTQMLSILHQGLQQVE